jgi:uncharacterized protein (DUF1778 family)
MAEKDTRIFIRVSSEEKKLIENKAKLAGFDTVSAYVLYFIRKA